ncbi:MAG: diguanylate cyclase [Sulfuricella sp.]|nr:diguanylate cyclase [Sulfuricella sp.]
MNRFFLGKKYWVLPALLWAAVVAASFGWNYNALNHHVRDLAANQGRFVFKMVDAVRLWNANHGGVYAAVSEANRPNPYLKVPDRDVVTTSGKALTLINPAYMTRQMADSVLEQSSMLLHLTSLKPLNPGNAADPWEAETLRSFEQGKKERLVFIDKDGSTTARYMAPLHVLTACMKCHEQQGYKVGDIRGGLSVTFSADTLLEAMHDQKRNLVLIHLAVWLLLSGLTLLALSSFRRQVLSLKQAKEQQDAMVELRTRELREEVHEREQAEAQLRLLINSSGEGVYGVDVDGNCTFCNPVALRLLGYRKVSEVIGRNMHDLIHHGRPDVCALPETCRLNVYQEGLSAHEENAVFCRADGSLLPVEYRSHPIYSEGRVEGAVVTFSDITERKRSQEQVWRQANYDGLTDLPNRNLFHDRLDQAVFQANRDQGQVALLFMDLDGFKEVNDKFGHDTGDLLLKETARRLMRCVRESDTMARIGGDEFTVILPHAREAGEAEAVAAKILGHLREPFHLQGQDIFVSVSIGIALYPRDADSSAVLLKHADAAMYRAKDAGKNTVRVHSS